MSTIESKNKELMPLVFVRTTVNRLREDTEHTVRGYTTPHTGNLLNAVYGLSVFSELEPGASLASLATSVPGNHSDCIWEETSAKSLSQVQVTSGS